jgi:hypothetical protein
MYKETLPICVIIVFCSFDNLHNYDLILSCLNFRKLYSRKRHFDALFLLKVIKVK